MSEKRSRKWVWIALGVFMLLIIGIVGDYPTSDSGPKKVAGAAVKIEAVDITSRGWFTVLIPEGATRSDLEKAAKEACREHPICHVAGWRSPENMPSKLPMLEREVDAQAFDYALNRNTNFERTLWDCKVYPEAKGQCL